MTTDPLGVISDVNRQMCEMPGHSREELVGSPFENYFTDPTRADPPAKPRADESYGLSHNVLESSTEDSIIAKDPDGNVLAWNEGAKRNYGYNAEEMVGKQNSRILHVPEDVASGRVDALLNTALQPARQKGPSSACAKTVNASQPPSPSRCGGASMAQR